MAREQHPSETERARRLAEVFGDVLPDTTSDERRSGSTGDEPEGRDESERWYRENRPPHHDPS
ncbi:hypothetical protein GIY23_02955 [Allosaccharopolyspora coralli]|uniref:Uncharacterized protein n=1 Tax=Allosaccharopolyspora coralli TaxID=2665642 RepID=A0A5Q3Q270_9PSEU|nr:hypothetical protein [Allosaccharopolyspora coralli]QGK68651.1 hypothetical protein GIY23_02955 [Allosaccharopolyspora coralli]